MSDIEIQRHLLGEATELSQALQTAIKIEMRVRNQMRIENNIPLTINGVQNTGGYRPAIHQQQNEYKFH